MKTEKRRSNCPISFALDVFGDKWSLLIVRDLVFTGKHTYSDFLKSDERIATNILASRLRTLESAGIIKRSPNKDDARKESYELTEKGLDLIPILMEFILWSAKYDPETIASKSFIAQARKIKSALLRKTKNSALP
jgi:DNA-binding HxlR family transcriptional regulator